MFPKPVKREKKRKPLRRGRSLTPATYAEARATMLALRARARRRRQRLVLNPRAVELVVRGTKHSRRPRAWGKMANVAAQRCDVAAAYVTTLRAELVVLLGFGLAGDGVEVGAAEAAVVGPCRGVVQVMHLRAQPGQHRAGEDRIAPGCEGHHKDIDGKVGGRGKWYVRLGRLGQIAFRNVLTARATARWEAQSPEARERWDAIAASRRYWRRT